MSPTPSSGTFRLIPADRIRGPKFNPRSLFDDDAHNELMESIRRDGLIEPIVVAPVAEEINQYYVIAGERRWRACTALGMGEIPSMLREGLEETAAVRLAILENLARKDLSPIEEARGFAELIRLKMKQKEIGEQTNRSQGAVANALRLLKLPVEVQDMILHGYLTATHGIKLLVFEKFPEVCITAAQAAIRLKWTAAQLDDGWNLVNVLDEAKVAIPLTYPTYAHDICEKCPLDAFKKVGFRNMCLRPDHYAELRAEKIRLAEEEAAKNKAGKKKKGEEVATIDTSKLKYGEYEVWQETTKPTACNTDCPCYRLNKHNQGCCIDPKRFKSLAQKQKRETKKQMRVDADKMIHEFRTIRAAAIQPHQGLMSMPYDPVLARCMAYLMQESANNGAQALKDAASEGLPADVVKALFNRGWDDRWEHCDVLAREILADTDCGVHGAARALLLASIELTMRYELKQWVENFGQSYAGPQKINRFAHYILYGTKPERTGPRAAQEAEVLLFCTRCKVPLDDYPDDDGNADALDDSFGDDGIINHPQGGMTVKYVTGHVEVVRPDWTEVMPYCVECSDSLSICRECGCTTEVACMNDGKACLWVEDDLCSACVKEEEPTDA